MCSQNRIYIRCIFRVGQIRMSAFQISYIRIFKYRIYVCPLHPRSVACSFADLEGFTIPSSFPQPTPPFMHFSLHTSPSTPSVTSLTITGSSQLQNGCGLELPKKIRQEYGVYTEIRRILPYIRRINTYKRKYGFRIRRGEAGKYGVYTVPYNTNTDLANPTHNTSNFLLVLLCTR